MDLQHGCTTPTIQVELDEEHMTTINPKQGMIEPELYRAYTRVFYLHHIICTIKTCSIYNPKQGMIEPELYRAHLYPLHALSASHMYN